jgi:VanZ family protein
LKILKLLSAFALVAYIVFIFYMSSLPNSQVPHASNFFEAGYIFRVLFRSLLHFAEYIPLGFLATNFFFRIQKNKKQIC